MVHGLRRHSRCACGNVARYVAGLRCIALHRDAIHPALVEARNRGVAVLLVSEDLDELLALADRILVISGGQWAYDSPIGEVDLQDIGHRMAGH